MAESKIKDIYNGEIITVWEDEDFIFLSFPYVVINIPKEEWDEVKKELGLMCKVKK